MSAASQAPAPATLDGAARRPRPAPRFRRRTPPAFAWPCDHRRRLGEQLPHARGRHGKGVPIVRVDVERADHPVRQQQRQRQRAVHPEPARPRAEPRPPSLASERPGPPSHPATTERVRAQHRLGRTALPGSAELFGGAVRRIRLCVPRGTAQLSHGSRGRHQPGSGPRTAEAERPAGAEEAQPRSRAAA